ncbi:head-tail connector protein [Schleiferilactobacillus harbinensis]|uniref:Uncharacterized protein n=1 Tax=Schleiferilactobacillus harbinensis TaxID=304207 RepID=A0A5P8M6G4_9LACO|nr:hypothetical protein [Schleiferilactobacillus harbinensis]QFR24090.1 hypothetical protein D1010_12235 [Schleiferilactobacillus harbinensis]
MWADAVTPKYYQEEYMGESVEADDFNRYRARAADVINQYCNYAFDHHVLTDLPVIEDQENVKKAVCAEIEYLSAIGGTTELADRDNLLTATTIGSFSYSQSGAKPLSRDNAQLSVAALRYLRPTGLLYRGAGQFG